MPLDKSKVFIGKVKSGTNNFSKIVNNGLSHFKDFFLDEILKKDDTIILKPNILPTEFRNEGLGVTNPLLCAAVAGHLKARGVKKILLAEGSTNNRKGKADTLEGMKNNGFMEHVDKWEPFDMNKDDVGKWFEIYSPGDEGNLEDPFDIEIGISKLALTYPIISIAKFKTHDVLGLTLSIKNLMGCLSKARRKSTGEILHVGPRVKSFFHGFGPKNPYQIEPRELNFTVSKTALAINLSRMAKNIFPIFSILDAAPAMEGKGPLRGTARDLDLILCSNDSVALDTIACKLVGIDLDYNQYIKNFERIGLGTADHDSIEIINQNLFNDVEREGNFKNHEWFKNAKFSPEEIALLHEYT